ncbi:hypothetical protein FRC08_018796 [Ceratobasidium sp. 394]|nr:hypothetical protein FRC08_018796 [Ceratobasidium sp. 394]
MPATDTEPTPRRGDRARSRSTLGAELDRSNLVLAASREKQKKKAHVHSQHEANALAAIEEEEEGEDSDEAEASPPPPRKKLAKSTISSSKEKQRAPLSPVPAKKTTSKASRGGSHANNTDDDEATRLKYVARIAARDKQIDHIKYDISNLHLIWVNDERVRDKESSSDGKQLFNSNNLKDLGTMDASDCTSQASLGKGKPTSRKSSASTIISHKSSGDLKLKAAASKQSASRVLSTSTCARSTSPAASSDRRLSSVTLKRNTNGDRPTSKLARMSARPAFEGDWLDSEDSFADEEETGKIGDTDGEAPGRRGKPKMGDYSSVDVDILDATVEAVSVYLLVHGWFADNHNYDGLISRVWRKKAATLTSRPHKHPLTIRKMRLTKYCVTSYQGRLKEAIKTAGLVQYYKLGTGTLQQIAARVDKLVSNNQFHMMTQFLIEAQAGGESTDEAIVRTTLCKYYNKHMQSLENIGIADPDTLKTLQENLFEAGVSVSKVKPVTAKQHDNDGGVIAVADIVRGPPLAKVGRTASPVKSHASEDEPDDQAASNEPSDDKHKVTSKLRGWPSRASNHNADTDNDGEPSSNLSQLVDFQSRPYTPTFDLPQRAGTLTCRSNSQARFGTGCEPTEKAKAEAEATADRSGRDEEPSADERDTPRRVSSAAKERGGAKQLLSSPQKRAEESDGESDGERRITPHRKRQVESDEKRELFKEGSSKAPKCRKHADD